MKELHRNVESKETLPNRKFQVTVIGPACSGKTTILNALREQGYSVQTEPDNPMMMRFIEDPRKYAFQNQVYKMAQLMEQEVASAYTVMLSDPYFRETGVLGTAIYNRYLRDQGLITPEQYDLLERTYEENMNMLRKPDMVVYLYADDETIKGRAIKRDGLVAHDPHELQPYFDELLQDLEARKIPVFRVNTGKYTIGKTKEIVLDKVQAMRESPAETSMASEGANQHQSEDATATEEPAEGIVYYRSIRLEATRP